MDIDAKGKVRTVRMVVSNPPFVFSESARLLAGEFRDADTYRSDGGLGCGGTTKRACVSWCIHTEIWIVGCARAAFPYLQSDGALLSFERLGFSPLA